MAETKRKQNHDDWVEVDLRPEPELEPESELDKTDQAQDEVPPASAGAEDKFRVASENEAKPVRPRRGPSRFPYLSYVLLFIVVATATAAIVLAI